MISTVMASQFRKRGKLPVVATSIVRKKRFKKVKTPLVYPPLASQACRDNCEQNSEDHDELQDGSDPCDLDGVGSDDDQPSQDGDLPSAHYRRREKAASAWDNLLPSLISSTVAMSCIPPATVCDRCKVAMASVRCKQCGPTTFLCDSCTVNHHSDEDFLGNAFHTPEKWINVRYITCFYLYCICFSLESIPAV